MEINKQLGSSLRSDLTNLLVEATQIPHKDNYTEPKNDITMNKVVLNLE